ncbi:MAG: LysM domain-containing protein [Archangium sp.]|nr:LysM domain-containing protein [Archangium sp.]
MSYRIQAGDTLSAIARRLNVSVDGLVKANPAILNPNSIRAGAELIIPGKQDDYVATAPKPPPVPQGNLQRGMTGTEVQDLQTDLVKLGFMTQAQVNTGPGILGRRAPVCGVFR